MSRTLTILVTFLLLPASLSVAGAREEPQPVISLQAESKEVFLGEPLYIHVIVTNPSTKPVDLPTSWGSGYFRMKITHEGTVLSPGTNCFSSPATPLVYGILRLAKGESYSRYIDILRLLGREKTGTYILQATLESDGRAPYVNPRTGKTLHRKCWAGKITSEPFTIKVKPLKEEKDVAALKAVTVHDSNFKNGFFTHIWFPGGDVFTGKDGVTAALRKYPTSIFAKHCQFALARAYGGRHAEGAGFFKEAVRYYTEVFTKYPEFHFTDDAKLALAKVYVRQHKYYPTKGHKAKVLTVLKDLMEKHPKSDSIRGAKKLQAELKQEKSKTGDPQPPSQPAKKTKKVSGGLLKNP